jgi:hypothetical protein
MYLKAIFVVVLILASSISGSAEYECTISRIDFGDDIDISEKETFIKQLVGKTLLVDTQDGVMTGVLNNSLFKPPLVLNHGDSENSFVAATIVSPKLDKGVVGVDTRILTIKTWATGKKKPFSLFWDDMLMRGRCTSVRKSRASMSDYPQGNTTLSQGKPK